jgi:ribonuclease M5
MEAGDKLRVRQAVVVEGKYDKIKLESLIDGYILTTRGFGVFRDPELRGFLRRLAAQRGLVVLTDSDTAGFKIRAYLTGMIPAAQITNVFIPDFYGKEKRKRRPSAEGKLGVEGMDLATLRRAFHLAGVAVEEEAATPQDPITRQNLYEDGFMGGEGSRERRYALYDRLNLPRRLNVTAALPLLNALLDRAGYQALVKELKGQPS